MKPIVSPSLFDSENNWPFVLSKDLHLECLQFLFGDGACPKVLNISGESGTGKSFFTREILMSRAGSSASTACLYVDIPPTDLEASAFFDKIALQLLSQKSATRASPTHIPKKIVNSWKLRNDVSKSSRVPYLYRVARDLTNQIPLLGPFIKAVLPSELSTIRLDHPNAALRFLLRLSHKEEVVIAIDNIQFIPHLLINLIESELRLAGSHLRLIIIERTNNNLPMNWKPVIANATYKDICLASASAEEIGILVETIFDGDSQKERNILTESIFRRSEGNLKSAWFQLKFIAERRESQYQEMDTDSYEGVIKSLPPIDQSVLRLVVFLLGGLSIIQVTEIFETSELKYGGNEVPGVIADLVSLGLLIINSDHRDRIKVEHEIVAKTVTNLTPEGEKLELREQLVFAISSVLKIGTKYHSDDALYDRLIGIAHEKEIRSNALIQSHIVRFIRQQEANENYSYLSNIFRDSVCWDVLDILPATTVKTLLNAVQKSSLFSFGLVATARLKGIRAHRDLASLFEAKYLVQLFRYTEALSSLKGYPDSKEKDSVYFNIYLNLCENHKAREIAHKIYKEKLGSKTEFELLILRNSGHLYKPFMARKIVSFSANGFLSLGSEYGFATSLNNLGIVDIFCDDIKQSQRNFLKAINGLSKLGSPEVYQPYINLSAIYLMKKDLLNTKKYLQLAKAAMPRSLAMDDAMLNFNSDVVKLIGGELALSTATKKFLITENLARKTQDLRFVEIVSWFTKALSSISDSENIEDARNLAFEGILEPRNAGLEIWVPHIIKGVHLKIPYILSPIWRY